MSHLILPERQRRAANHVIVAGCENLLRNAGAVHYTQGPRRWSAMDHHLRIAHGDYLREGDCSSTYTWLVWNGITHALKTLHVPDYVNGEGWRAGFTGTIAAHGRRVHHDGNLRVGDAILYGPAPTYEHVALYLGGGVVFSHGGEGGPYRLRLDYRPDRGASVRFY